MDTSNDFGIFLNTWKKWNINYYYYSCSQEWEEGCWRYIC